MFRRAGRFAVASSVGLLALIAVAQPPAEAPVPPPRTQVPFEEEEPNPKKTAKRIELDEDLSDLATANGAYYVRLDELVRAAGHAKNPNLKHFFGGLTVAYDRLVEAKQQTRITPIPFLWGKDKFPDEFGVVPLGIANRPEDVRTLTPNPKVIRRIEPFELVAITEVDRLIDPPANSPPMIDPPSMGERLAAGERVLSEVLLFHDRARELGKRKGKGWDPVKAAVNDRLTAIRVARVRQAVADKDWPTVRAIGGRLADRYRNDPKVLEVVFAARLSEAEEAIRSDRVADLERVKALLNEYDARFPGSGNETIKRLRLTIQDRAKKLFSDAERLALANPTEARNILRSVESLEPDLNGLREKQQELKAGYAVLVVGTPRLPEMMSPATARFDSEHQAVELMFEGLLEPIPDDVVGVRFRPALAADRPSVAAGLRDVPLVGSAEWAGAEKGAVDLADLTDTVKLLKAKPDSWSADPVAWLDDPTVDPADPGKVRIRFRQGHPDPRELLTFKLLPARWLTAQGKAIDDVPFARRPFGTGPFRLAANYRPPSPGEDRTEVVFHSNPGYGKRPARMGQPSIKEVRFKSLNSYKLPDKEGLPKTTLLDDLVNAVRNDRLHLLTDVPTADLVKYSANNGLNGKVRVLTASTPRRMHILAINHRRPSLQSTDLRRGLSHVIDRDKVLNEVFRAGQAEFHRPLTGPFPPGTWAEPKPLGVPPGPLFDRDSGAAKLKAYRNAGGAGQLTLSYPLDDELAKAACERIKNAVDTTETGVTLNLEPLPPRDFLRRVEEEQRYDLAYVPFDYRDDWYPLTLGSFLDPMAAGIGGRNYLGYRAAGTNPTPNDARLGELLAEVRLTRDPAGKLAPLSHEIHKRFNDTMPFIPLWQLDRHIVISSSIKVMFDGRVEEANPRWLDQTRLFTSIGKWRME